LEANLIQYAEIIFNLEVLLNLRVVGCSWQSPLNKVFIDLHGLGSTYGQISFLSPEKMSSGNLRTVSEGTALWWLGQNHGPFDQEVAQWPKGFNDGKNGQ
jgi:hypothetical protein